MDVGAFGFLFSHDDSATTSTWNDRQDQRDRQSDDDEAGPGRPLEMLFSGDGEPAPRRAAS